MVGLLNKCWINSWLILFFENGMGYNNKKNIQRRSHLVTIDDQYIYSSSITLVEMEKIWIILIILTKLIID